MLCVCGGTDVGDERLELLQSGLQPWWCRCVVSALIERLKGFQSTLGCLDVAAVLLLCSGLLPRSLGAGLGGTSDQRHDATCHGYILTGTTRFHQMRADMLRVHKGILHC